MMAAPIQDAVTTPSRRRSRKAITSVALVAANLVPIAGIAFLDWNAGLMLLTYWLETLVVGFYTVLKLRRVQDGGAARKAALAFFVVQYGVFALAHGLFVLVFLDPEMSAPQVRALFRADVLFGGASLLVSHGISYVMHFLGNREYERLTLEDQLKMPYRRVAIMHTAIVFGSFFVVMLGAAAPAIAILAVMKIALDLRAHWREHAQPS